MNLAIFSMKDCKDRDIIACVPSTSLSSKDAYSICSLFRGLFDRDFLMMKIAGLCRT